MSTITFSNGVKVNFNGTPTQKDIEEVAARIAQGTTGTQGSSNLATVPKEKLPFGTIPSTGKETSFGAAAKTAFNVIPSAVGIFSGMAKEAAGLIGGLPKALGQLPEQLRTLPQQIQQAQQQKLTLPNGAVTTLGEGLYRTLLPSAVQNLIEGSIAHVQGDSKVADEKFLEAQKQIIQNPSGTILPFLILGRQGAEQLGFGKEFDAGIARTAELVTKPISKTVSKGANLVRRTAEVPAALESGVGIPDIERAYQAGKAGGASQEAFRASLTGKTSEEGLVDIAQSALDDVIEQRRTEYLENLKKLENETFTTKEGQLYVKRELTPEEAAKTPSYKGGATFVPTELRLQNLKAIMTQTLKDIGLEAKQGVIDFSNRPTLDAKNIQTISDLVYGWDDITPRGLDLLLQEVRDFRKGGLNLSPADNRFNYFVDRTASTLKKYVETKVPQIEKLHKDYATDTEFIQDIKKGFSLNAKPGSVEASFNKLTKALRTDNQFKIQLLDSLEKQTGMDIQSAIAGMNMRSLTPRGKLAMATDAFIAFNIFRGLGALLNPAVLLELLFVSPRVVAEFFNALGVSRRVVSQIISPLLQSQLPANRQIIDTFLEEAKKAGGEVGEVARNISKSQEGFAKLPGGESQAPKQFKGFSDITTKVLDRLKGKSVTSKQEILNFTNMPELKQAERDIIRNVADTYKEAKIPVQDFANKVKSELLPLKVTRDKLKGASLMTQQGRYENIALPNELRGNVKNYSEKIYESPIKTSAGDVHFRESDNPNYFGHTRIEDMAANPADVIEARHIEEGLKRGYRFEGTKQIGRRNPKETLALKQKLADLQKSIDDANNTRRVIEVQSDLYQKNRLGEQNKDFFPENLTPELAARYEKIKPGMVKEGIAKNADIAKLSQYNDPTAHFRMIREEVKQAAKDGKTKLQFPTGETAMKIEGLGESEQFWNYVDDADGLIGNLSPNELKVGREIHQQADEANAWIITDVLGDGKFKAAPKEWFGQLLKDVNSPGEFFPTTKGKMTMEELMKSNIMKDSRVLDRSESFDISGKVDTSNPIFRFYEKEVGRYLKNKYNAQLVTDSKGVKWWEVPIKKSYAKEAVTAFGLGALGVGLSQKND